MSNSKYSDYLGQPSQSLRTWMAALYIRLSREDEMAGESNSVVSQREILKEYLKLHPDITCYDTYVDDGWSGTNFDRPDFTRMMEDINAGRVNCVIVKDLSRFGRNYSQGGELITNEFARLGVRFIALNNGYDTFSNNMSAATQCITLGVTNVINESVAATTSVNVRGTLNVNRQQGKFIGSFPTYGYMKDPEDHHKLIIDEEAAPTVRMIFEKFIDGESIIGIAKDLNEMGIPNPSMYKKLKGLNYKHPVGAANDGLWPDSSVRRILTNEMYTGTMVQGKNRNISYKDQRAKAVPKEEWYRVEGTHEPIIDRDTFDKAQSLFNRNIRKAPNNNNVHLFAGLIKCGTCHRAMNRKFNSHAYGVYGYYRCATARKMRKGACTNHSIRIDKLEEAVLVYLQTVVKTAVSLDEVLKKINNSPARKKESNHVQKLLKTQQAERDKLVRNMVDLYPDWKAGVISQEEYMLIKANMSEKIKALDAMIANLEKNAAEIEKGISTENDFIAHFKKYGNFEKLTRGMLVELVEEIRVHEGGMIEIDLKFADAYKQVIEYIELNENVAKAAS